MHLRLGLDIGGTKMEAAILATYSGRDEVLARERVPTQREEGFTNVYKRMIKLINNVLNQNGTSLSDLAGIGIGLPGAVDPKTRQMLNGNTAIFVGQDLPKLLALDLAFSGPIAVANDANCFALAEAILGIGQKHAKETGKTPEQLNSIGVILGTGVGGGLIYQGRVLEGTNGGAGEIGHTQLDPNGPKCFCGRQGCAETFLSGKGLESWYGARFGEQLFALQIFDRAEMMDKNAVLALKIYRDYLDQFMLNLISFFDPDFIVLGGGVSLQPAIYQGLEERIWKHTFIPNAQPRIYPNMLGDSAGVIGAALLVP
ncbi:MAG: ROK family protein [Bdellovibrio sp.]|nr:ROK family protein [Bdellovibrio sp.]